MKQITSFCLKIILILSALALASCASIPSKIEQPRITLAGIEPLNMTLFEQTYRLKLRVQNPNDFDIPLEGMHYIIELNGTEFGQGTSHQRITIPAYDSTIVETEVVSNLFSLFEKLKDFSLQGNNSMKYHLFGKIKLGSWNTQVPFDYDGMLNLNLSK